MKTFALREVVSVVGGGTPRKSSPEYYGGPIPWVTPKDMKRQVITSSLVTLTQQGVQNSPAKLVPRDAVLVVVRSGVLKHTLPVALTGVPVTLNQDMKGLIPGDAIHGAYLARLVKALEPTVLSWVRATTADNFPIDKLLDFEINLPDLDEQRRIAAILDHADTLRAKQRRVVAQLDDLVESLFDSYFRNDDWPLEPLSSLAEVIDCPHSTPQWTDSGEVCVRTSNLVRGDWDWKDKRYVSPADYTERSQRGEASPGDIILSREGTVGVAAIVEEGMKLCMGQRLVRLQMSDRLKPHYALRFLLKALHPDRIGHAMVGSTARHLNVKDLRNLLVPVPSTAFQDQFACRVDQIQQLHGHEIQSATQLDELFASLQSRAFRGEL